MNTGEKIKQHRLIKKISPKDIAAILDMDVSNYYKIERDEVKPDIEKIVKIAEAFGVEPKDLLPDDKFTFNISHNTTEKGGNGYLIYHDHSNDKLVELQEKRIKDLEDKIKMQEEIIALLKAKDVK